MKRRDYRVVIVARPKTRPSSEHSSQSIDWSCCWLVRGHYRAAHTRTFKNGTVREVPRTWVRPYIKGPDDKPLNITDVIYRMTTR